MNRLLIFSLMCSLILLIGCQDSGDEAEPIQYDHHEQFSEKAFLQGVYFWIADRNLTLSDGKSVAGFRDNYRRYNNRQHITLPPEDQPSDIELYVSINFYDSTETILFGRAAAIQFLPVVVPDSLFPQDQNHTRRRWMQLSKGIDYEFSPQLGYVRLKQTISNGQALACAFSTARGDTFGTLRTRIDSLDLVLLKPQSPMPTDSTWNLMFRHVYSLRTLNLDPDHSAISICRKLANGLNEYVPSGSHMNYLSLFGFDLENTHGERSADGIVDNYRTLINYPYGELHFLDLTPFDPSGFYDPITAEYINAYILDSLELSTGDTTGFRAPYLYNVVPSAITAGPLWRFHVDY